MRFPTTTTILLLAAAAASAQAPVLQTYGAGCAFFGQTLQIGTIGQPSIGTVLTLTYSGPNLNNQLSVQPVLALGLGAVSVPLPQALWAQQPPGCTLLVTAEVLLPMPVGPVGAFVDRFELFVPNDPGLIGFQFTGQWLGIVVQCGIIPPCTWDGLPASDAVLATIGL